MSMLTDLLEWAIHPLHHEPAHVTREPANAEYEALLACYRSEQMSAAQLRAHMEDDPEFEQFITARLDVCERPPRKTRDRVLVHH